MDPKMNQALTDNEIRTKIKNKFGDNLAPNFKYENDRQELDIICGKCDEHFTTTWNSYSRRKTPVCKCGDKSIEKKIRVKASYEVFKDLVETKGYKAIYKDEYNDNFTNKTKVETICPKGHSYITCINQFKDMGEREGSRCITCYKDRKNNFK